MSKYVRSYRAPQNPLVEMSSLAPSCVLEVACERTSPVRGSRSGTSGQTSVKRLAVISLISLCLIDGKPPFGQDKV